MKNKIQFKERITDETEKRDLTNLLFELPVEVVSENNPNENPDLLIAKDAFHSKLYICGKERLTAFYHIQTLERAKLVKVNYSQPELSLVKRLSLSHISNNRDCFAIGLLDNRLGACNLIIYKFYW